MGKEGKGRDCQRENLSCEELPGDPWLTPHRALSLNWHFQVVLN